MDDCHYDYKQELLQKFSGLKSCAHMTLFLAHLYYVLGFMFKVSIMCITIVLSLVRHYLIIFEIVDFVCVCIYIYTCYAANLNETFKHISFII
jgi:hypothetical protein